MCTPPALSKSALFLILVIYPRCSPSPGNLISTLVATMRGLCCASGKAQLFVLFDTCFSGLVSCRVCCHLLFFSQPYPSFYFCLCIPLRGNPTLMPRLCFSSSLGEWDTVDDQSLCSSLCRRKNSKEASGHGTDYVRWTARIALHTIPLCFAFFFLSFFFF